MLKQITERIWMDPPSRRSDEIPPAVGVICAADQTVVVDPGNSAACARRVQSEIAAGVEYLIGGAIAEWASGAPRATWFCSSLDSSPQNRVLSYPNERQVARIIYWTEGELKLL